MEEGAYASGPLATQSIYATKDENSAIVTRENRPSGPGLVESLLPPVDQRTRSNRGIRHGYADYLVRRKIVFKIIVWTSIFPVGYVCSLEITIRHLWWCRVLLRPSGQGIFSGHLAPVGTGPGRVHVADGGEKVLVDPRVVGVVDAVFGANFADLGGNVGIPSAAHAWEQVVFNLKVETSREATGKESTVSAGSFDLCLEPVDWFSRLFQWGGRIAIRGFEIVRQRKQDRQRERFRHTHEHDVSKDTPGPFEAGVGVKRSNHVHRNVHGPPENRILASRVNESVVETDTDGKCAALLEVKNLWIEDSGQPVSSQDGHVKECLKAM